MNEQSDTTTFKVPFTSILAIDPHNNADRLELATVYGFQVIVQKGAYKPGDNVVYVPIDSILPADLEDKLFPPDSKIKLHHHRVRQIKIRGLASQGMLISLKELNDYLQVVPKVEEDLKEVLGITKYEPSTQIQNTPSGKKARKKRKDHPLFHRYNGVDNIKWFPNFFKEGEEVVIQEKLHGTNARFGILPHEPRTFWQKVKKFLRLAPKWEKVWGSNNVELSSKIFDSNYYSAEHDNLYGRIAGQHLDKLEKFKEVGGVVVFGEIIGPNIQKNYDYGLKEPKFILFDVWTPSDGYWNPHAVETFAQDFGFEMVPMLYKGSFNKLLAYELSKGKSVYSPSQLIREGCVIKRRHPYTNDQGKKNALKYINEDYLADPTNTDEH